MKFIKFMGNAAVAGKQVAVYRDGDKRVLRPETVGGRRLRVPYTDEHGKQAWKTLTDVRVEEAEYRALVDAWEADRNAGSPGGDAVVVQRALAHCGYED